MVKTRKETLRNQVNTMRASRSTVRKPLGKRGQLRGSRLRSVSRRPATKRKRLPLQSQASGKPHDSQTLAKSRSKTGTTRKIKKRQHAPKRDKSPEDLSDSSSSSDANSGSSEPVKNKKGTKQRRTRGKRPRKRPKESSEESMDTSNMDSSSSEEDQSSQKKKHQKLLDIFDTMSSDSDSSVSESDDSFALGIFSDSTAPQLSKNMKKKIWNREFINLAKLYYGQESDNLSINVKKPKANTLTSLRRAPQREINNVLSWSRAFQLYASIYTKKYSKEGSGMFQYMSIIQSLAHKGQNWLFYDQKFRQLRAKRQLPWGRLHVQTHLFQSLSKPKFPKDKSQGFRPGRAPPAPNNVTQQQQGLPSGPRAIFRPGFCWTYQRYGNCNRSNCSRVHKCSLCDGQHAGTSCSRFTQQGNSGQLNQGKPKTSPDTANTNKGQSVG